MKKENKYLQVNDMLFELQEGEEITSILFEIDEDGHEVICIDGFTPSCEFSTTYHSDITITEWRGHGKDDIWTSQENYNIINYDIVKD